MALGCELTSVRGDRGENYENAKKKKKRYLQPLIKSRNKSPSAIQTN
jgi:ribosomal protein L28